MEPFDNRGDFEQAFSSAFEGAEIAPEPQVWNRIDAVLAKSQNNSFRKRLLFFQLVAAASLVFAAGITLYQVFKSDSNSTITISSNQKTETEIIRPEDPSGNPLENKTIHGTSDANDERIVDNSLTLGKTGNELKKSNVPEAGLSPNVQDYDATVAELKEKDDHDLTESLAEESPTSRISAFSLSIEPNGYLFNTELNTYEPLFIPIWTKKVEDEKSGMWASAGFSAGSYNPSSGGLNLGLAAADEATDFTPTNQQDGTGIFSDQQSGRSIGGGLGFGSKVSKKWLLESGLNYIHSEIDGTTNGFIESNGNNYPVFYESKFAGAIQNTASYGVTSSLDFISVPIKAGYILVDKKIGWVATGGVGSNFLIGNSLNSDLGQLEKINYSVADSPYRRLSWSGIIGTEVYFNITEDYQLLVVPQYNFGITEITRQESSFSIVPNSFNLGIRFRYLLK